ncbi:hypothetical protein HK102_009577, partial [Quaeritorhiza haematococci]
CHRTTPRKIRPAPPPRHHHHHDDPFLLYVHIPIPHHPLSSTFVRSHILATHLHPKDHRVSASRSSRPTATTFEPTYRNGL